MSKSCLTPCELIACSTPGFPVLHYVFEFVQTQVHWVSDAISNHFILCHPLLLLPSIFPSIRVLSNESSLPIRWPKYYCFSFSISPSKDYSRLFPLGLTGLISLLSKGLLSVFSSTTVWKHQFFGAQPSLWSNSHIHTGKTIVLTIHSFVRKVMSLLFNMLSRFVIAFLPRIKHLFNFQATFTIHSDFEAPQIKSATVSIYYPSICHEVMGPDIMIFMFWMLSFSQLFHPPLSP